MLGLIKFLKKRTKPQTAKLELSDIQGILLSGYGHLNQSRYLFLNSQNAGATKAWLQQLLDQHELSSGQWEEKPKAAVNLAFTYPGLAQLGVSKTLKNSFSREFKQGMRHPERSRRLGDYDLNDPQHWEDCWKDDSVHLLLILQAADNDIETLCQDHQNRIKQVDGLSIVKIESGGAPKDHREHFGFMDGISQPLIEGSPANQKLLGADQSGTIKAGEFILGYLNEDGFYPPTPFVSISEDIQNCLSPAPNRDRRDFGRNGTYIVYRKLEQDVPGFRTYFRDQFESEAEGKRMAAKLLGRWPSGAPLVEAPNEDPHAPNLSRRNGFSYRDSDPEGFRCPFASHIRRMNPRDSLGDDANDAIRSAQRRRIVRRGAIYGSRLPEGQYDSDGQARGVLFFCLNANIRRQFEFIQQSWVNNSKFHGANSERDPLIGNNPDGSNRTFTIPDPTGRKTLHIPNFVTLKGGAYFFIPSFSALKFLALVSGN